MWENKEDIHGWNKVLPSWSPYHVALHLNEMQGRGRLRCRMMGRRSCHDVPILESDCRLTANLLACLSRSRFQTWTLFKGWRYCMPIFWKSPTNGLKVDWKGATKQRSHFWPRMYLKHTKHLWVPDGRQHSLPTYSQLPHFVQGKVLF